MSPDLVHAAGDLLASHRWAALATLDQRGWPIGSMVAFCPDPESGSFVIHVSSLAEHTGNLTDRHYAALTVGAADPGKRDPQTLARLSVQTQSAPIRRDNPSYDVAQARYQRQFPASKPRFGFGDFVLMRLVPIRGQFVGGFAAASALTVEEVTAAIRISVGDT